MLCLFCKDLHPGLCVSCNLVIIYQRPFPPPFYIFRTERTHCDHLNLCDPCPRKAFDVEGIGSCWKFPAGSGRIFPPYFGKGQSACECQQPPTVSSLKLCRKWGPQWCLQWGILISVTSGFKSPNLLCDSCAAHAECTQRRVRAALCHWFVHHQWLLLFEGNSTCFNYTWLVLPQHRNQFSPAPHCRSAPSLRCSAARLLSRPSPGSRESLRQ